MHEKRNFLLTMILIGALAWAFFAWLIAPDYFSQIPNLLAHKVASAMITAVVGCYLFYVFRFEDKMEDQLGKVTGGRYFEQEGLCFMPLVRMKPNGEAEISLYYQNKYSNPCETVIHLRPPANSMASHRGARDIHFAFIAQPGSYGVIHQPIAVHPKARGQVLDVQLAAATHWPMGHGERLCSQAGMPCGTFNVDWAMAFRQKEHELGGELELKEPAIVHLTMPEQCSARVARTESSQEVLMALA